MRTYICAFWIVTLLVVGWRESKAGTLRVATDGSGDYELIKDALHAAVAGDTIIIMPGDYDESDGERITIIVGKPLTIRGGGVSPAQTNVRISIFFQGRFRTVIENIRLHDEYNAVFDNGGDLIIRNAIFEDNRSGLYGTVGAAVTFAAMYVPGSLTIEDSVFLGNLSLDPSDLGGAVGVESGDVTIRRCLFKNNECSGRVTEVDGAPGALLIRSGSLMVEDCVFWDNKGIRAGAICSGLWDGSVNIVGCTFYRNECSGGSSVEVAGFTPGAIERCIFAGTQGGVGVGCWNVENIYCCNFWENEGGDYGGDCEIGSTLGDFNADPLLCDPENGDFRLIQGSPCLPGSHGGYQCGLIGASDEMCATPTKPVTWGRIKSLFRDATR
jgi:hypothetical protein